MKNVDEGSLLPLNRIDNVIASLKRGEKGKQKYLKEKNLMSIVQNYSFRSHLKEFIR